MQVFDQLVQIEFEIFILVICIQVKHFVFVHLLIIQEKTKFDLKFVVIEPQRISLSQQQVITIVVLMVAIAIIKFNLQKGMSMAGSLIKLMIIMDSQFMLNQNLRRHLVVMIYLIHPFLRKESAEVVITIVIMKHLRIYHSVSFIVALSFMSLVEV